jgi:EAL domain-containing protein (putative c-di-GMP-specific phosphodiesterase class I)
MELHRLELELMETKIQNKQMAQLLNWIAVTNPQVLDEFQTTASAFEKLVPRNGAGQDESSRAPSDV